jgi:drug/metabolite transporter (DMT)-like permease
MSVDLSGGLRVNPAGMYLIICILAGAFLAYMVVLLQQQGRPDQVDAKLLRQFRLDDAWLILVGALVGFIFYFFLFVKGHSDY